MRSAALSSIDKNIPADAFGTVIANQTSGIVLTSWDPEIKAFDSSGTLNAVRVTLHRDSSTDYSVGTFLLDSIGIVSWSFASSASTAMAQTQKCNNTEGIFAIGDIQLRSHNGFGPGICLHSDDQITMSNHNTFDPGTFLSMPNLEDCAKCDDDSKNLGVVDAAYEAKYKCRILES